MVAHVCYDVCSHCGRTTTPRPGTLRFADLPDGARFQSCYDRADSAPVLIKGRPPMYQPANPAEIAPNAYAEEGAGRRYISFGPDALVWRL